jgi:type I restriction enzyme S subunit
MDGEFGCYEWKGDNALLNQRVCRLQDFSEKLEPRFLFYGINKYLKEIEDATTFTTVKHLSSKQISKIEILLPPIAE